VSIASLIVNLLYTTYTKLITNYVRRGFPPKDWCSGDSEGLSCCPFE
jgi:hypothetical protein